MGKTLQDNTKEVMIIIEEIVLHKHNQHSKRNSVFTGCNVTRQNNACLELICEKWSHSLIELDLSWASAARVLDDAVSVLADSTTSRLKYVLFIISLLLIIPQPRLNFS